VVTGAPQPPQQQRHERTILHAGHGSQFSSWSFGENLDTRKWPTTMELAIAMADYIGNFYNTERRHADLGNQPPSMKGYGTTNNQGLNSHNPDHKLGASHQGRAQNRTSRQPNRTYEPSVHVIFVSVQQASSDIHL
jgi:hypothetical protein